MFYFGENTHDGKFIMEYQDKTVVQSDSDSDVIDESLVENDSFSTKKKNHTAFVAESDEASSDDRKDESHEDIEIKHKHVKSLLRRSNIIEAAIDSSSDDEVQASPIMMSRHQPLTKFTEKTKSLLNKHKKRLMIDSESDNSIIIEHNRNKKLVCLKDTPIKIDKSGKVDTKFHDKGLHDSATDMSINKSEYDEDSEIISSDEDENNDTHDEESFLYRRNSNEDRLTEKVSGNGEYHVSEGPSEDKITKKYAENNDNDDDVDKTPKKTNKNEKRNKIIESDESADEAVSPSEDEDSVASNATDDSDDEIIQKSTKKANNRQVIYSDDDDGPDEDQMAISRATRMSIMGLIPKENASDDSDFIQSDDSHRKSGESDSATSMPELPEAVVDKHNIPVKTKEQELDNSKITCSSFEISSHDIDDDVMDLTKFSPNKDNVASERFNSKISIVTGKNIVKSENFTKHEDDVTIIESKPEIIALSSDEEDEVKLSKSPKPTDLVKLNKEVASPKNPKDNETTKSYLLPPSYPNQGVVYVKKQVRENELSKLNGLQEDLHNVRHLLENMDVDTLPDGGLKLMQRLNELEAKTRLQAERVANMVVEPENPTAEDIARDGFEKGLSWEEIQQASNAVQPKMFGAQAMATHMAERSVMLDRLRDLLKSLESRPPESELADPPKAVSTKLMPHQLHALAWLRWRETQRPAAGILADDMGLGKTITMIALVVSDKDNRVDDDEGDGEEEPLNKNNKMPRGGTLVVCPASLIQQWAGEVTKHCAPHCLSVCLHHGPTRATQPHRLSVYDLVLTTYNILQRDKEKNGVLMRVRWRRAILDEAHSVRNYKSATAGAVFALDAARRWCLTGTPVQNKDLDLFALLKFLRCSPFDELAMWKKWIDNKSLGGQERLNTIMRCMLLRRTKVQLQQRGQLDCLPDRSSHQKHVTLTKAEMNVYQKVLVFSKTLFAQFLHQRADKNSDATQSLVSNKNTEYEKMHKRMVALHGVKPVKSHEILVLLLRLRQVCCHCGLIAAMLDEEGAGDVYEDPAGGDLLAELNKLSLEDAAAKRKQDNSEEAEEENVPEEETTVAEAIRSVLSPNNPVFELDRSSSKIKAVMDCLKENVFSKKDEKAVVVSQWTSVLRLVEREVAQLKVKSVMLNGSVPVPARQPLIQKLNDPTSDIKVMLLSLCAGGVGLNLCGANHLLLVDPHWNPQLEEQAQDRIYRVGQKKAVHIYKFMCVDTVEQTIRKLQEVKLELADNVLTGARNTNASKLTIEDLKMLFNMGQGQ